MHIDRGYVKRNYKKIISLILSVTWIVQLLWNGNIALGAPPYSFKGYENENITSETFSCSGATKNWPNISMTSSAKGEAVGFISFADSGADISQSIDLGSLEIDFSTVSTVTLEGDAGAENDVPAAKIDFCATNDYQDVISSVNLTKPDNSVAGSVTLSSGASIPAGTRSVIIYLSGTNTNASSSNTVVFSSTSLKIHDAAAPSCSVSYSTGWTNAQLSVTITASDGDSGLEGIYKDGVKVSSTSPYTFTVPANTSFSAYSKDYAGKTSDVQNISITNIDYTAPSAPGAITLSHDTWTNTNVSVTMPALGTSTGSPEKYIYSLNGGAWQDLPSDFSVSANGQHDISVKVADAAGNASSAVTDKIYIDKLAPSINSITPVVSSGSAVVSVSASDAGLSGIDKMKYAAGSHDAAYFATGGTDITGNQFTITAGGTYTVFVSDRAGNHDLKEYGLNTAPALEDITDKSINEDTPLNIPLNVTDSETSLDKLTVTAVSSDTTLVPSVVVNKSASAISLDITPGANLYGGPATITVQITDEQGETVSDTFRVTVLSQNDPPAAADDTASTNEDTSVTINVLANDADAADNDTLSISDAGTPGHGTAAAADGKIVYTPNANYNGSDSFTYTVSDGKGGTASATVTVTINEVNDAPTAAPDSASLAEDGSVLIDVLANDTDPDTDTTVGEVITLVSAANGTHGTTAIEGTQVRYTPDPNWFGKDGFTYTISDGDVSKTGTVSVTVTGVEDKPWFEGLNSSYTIDEDSVDAEITFSIKDVETEADSLMLQAVSTDETLLKNSKLSILGLGDSGDTVTLRLTPEANKYRTLTINLALGDGFNTVTGSFTLNIANVNDVPVANTDTVYFNEDTERITIATSTLIANDTDIDGDTLSFVDIVTTTHVGTLTPVDETKTAYYYDPPAGYDGTDSFTYSVSDGLATVTGTCNIIAVAGNDAPVITLPFGSVTTNEDTAKGDIVFNISDQETDAAQLIVTAGSDNTDLISTDDISVVNNGDGTCTMSVTPMPDANGTAVITVTLSDGNLKTIKSFDLNITAVPDAPVAVDDYAYIPASGELYFDVLLNDRDADGDALSIASVDSSLLPGSLTYDSATHRFKYTARTGETGTYTFTYTVSDGDATTLDDSGTVTLDVNAMTHQPRISPVGSRYINEDGSTGVIGFSVTDADYGDEVTVTATSGNTTLVPQDGSHIVLTDNLNGTYSLIVTPEANRSGSAEITISVSDKQLHIVTYTFWIYVNAVNDPPVAVSDTASVNEDSSVTLDMLTNDSDPEGDNLWINAISWPAHGWLSRSGSTYTYAPYANYNGTETLTYSVTDGENTRTANIVITVAPVNDAPVARDEWAEVPNAGSEDVTVSVLSNDSDIDGDTLKTYEIVTQGAYGTAVVNPDNTITYTRSGASPLSNGEDSFVYRVIDRADATGDYAADTATVHIGIDFVTTLECDEADIYCSEDSAPVTITLPIRNPNSVNYAINVGTTSLGTFEVIDNTSGNDTQVRFTPAPDASGSQTVSYTISGEGENATSYIYVYVYPVNDAPEIDSAPASVSCNEDALASISAAFHDVDCDAGSLYFSAYAANITSGGPIPLTASISVARNGGTADVTVTPAPNSFGSMDIVLVVSDGLQTATHTVHMTVDPVDDAPILSAVSVELFEDTSETFYVTTPSSEVDGDNINVSIADGSGPAHGIATVNPDGTITYTPNENWYGTDSLTFSVADETAAALTSTQTADISVTSINDPPVISDIAYFQTTNEDTVKHIGFTVTDPDNDLTGASSYTITSDNESLIPAGNITVSHLSGNYMALHVTPAANKYGYSIIGITVSDGSRTAHADIKLTVTSVNDLPNAIDDSATVTERSGVPAGTTSTTISLIDNDSDVEDGKPQIVGISDVSAGSVVNNKNGTVTYSVNGDFNGTATFNYTVMDKNGATDTAQVTVNVEAANDPPHAANDSRIIDEDESVTIPVLDNDGDADGDTVSISGTHGALHGTATVSGTDIIYTPDENYYGTDSFTYDISDGNGGTASANVSITINPFNDAPALDKHSSTSGAWEMNEDETKAFNITVSDPETATPNLIITITSLDETILKSTNIVLSTPGDYKAITVTPEDDKNGVVPVRFSVTDGVLTTTKTFDITILAVNDAPVLTTPSNTTKEDTPVSGAVTATDVDSSAVSLTFSKASDPAHGSVTVNADGTYTYTPEANWSGTDSFGVTVSDGAAENSTDTGSVSVTVTPVNDPPTAVNDEPTTPEDTAVTVNVLGNDTDPDTSYGDTLTVTSAGSASHGTTEIVEGGIKYTPQANWNGTDSFTYSIKDSANKTSSATVSVTVMPVNDAPSGGNDTAETDEDIAVTIDVTANDDLDETTNPAIEDVLVTLVDDPVNGTAQITADSKGIKYTPDANWSGTDTFSYTARDVEGATAVFTVTVTVKPINDKPEIIETLPDVTINEDGTANVSLTVQDVEDAASSLVVTASRSNTTLLPAITVTSGTGGERSFTIAPNANKNGTASITVRVTDLDGAYTEKQFDVSVTPVNDVPVAHDDAVSTNENTAVTVDVLSNDDVDINDGDTLTITGVSAPAIGTYEIVTENGRQKIKYTPANNLATKVNGTETLTYTMKDASEATSGATLTITVTPVNDAPTISNIADITGILEDAPGGTGAVGFTVQDEEDDDDTLGVVVTSCSNEALFPLSNITVLNPEGADGTRTVQAIPAANAYGTATIRLTVSDVEGLKAYDDFTVTVDSVNDDPANGNDAFTVTEDVEKQLDVLANDDVDGTGSLTVDSIIAAPTHGTVTIAGDKKSVYYKTYADSNEADAFTYRVYDSYGLEYQDFNVTITVTPVNDAPVVTLVDSGTTTYTVNEGGLVSDIRFSVTDVDDSTDCAIFHSVAASSTNPILVVGGLHIDEEGGIYRNLDIQAYNKWNGTTTIKLTATDTHGAKGTAQLTFVVNSVNEAPVANDDTFTVQEDALTKLLVLTNDTDGDLETNSGTEFIKVSSVTDNDPNAVITATASGDGVNIQPAANYNGPVSFTYVTEDAAGEKSNTASVSVTVNQVNDAPVATDDTPSTNEDTAVDIYVLANDTDVDQQAGLNTDPAAEVLGVSTDEPGLLQPAHGSISVLGTKITYTPAANYNGTDSFEYNVDDGQALDKGLVTVTISQVNDAPVANNDSASTDEDTPVDFYPLENDTDTDTDEGLNQGTLHNTSDFVITDASLAAPVHGTLSQSGAKLTYTPEANFFGSQTVTYTMSDGHGGTASAAVDITVNSVNDLPQFSPAPAGMSLSEDGTDGVSSFTVTDVETAGASLAVTVESSSNETLVQTSDVSVATISGGDRTVTVNPKNNQNGSSNITLRVTDADGGHTDYTFAVNVTAFNDAPAAQDVSATIAEDTVYSIDWRTITSDVDAATNGDTRSVTIEAGNGAGHGTAQVSGNNITYTPGANWNGVDSFTYTVTDSQGASDTGVITITVTQVNDAPVAADDTAAASEDTPLDIFVLDNDSDKDQDSGFNADPAAEMISVSIDEPGLLQPAHGSISVSGNKIVYTPAGNYNGTDSFEYNVDDGQALDKGLVSVTIAQVNDNPVAVTDSASTGDEDPVDIHVLDNDTDVDTIAALNENQLHSKSTFSVQSYAYVGEGHGTLTEAGGVITYTPSLNFAGTQQISYVLSDGHGGTATGIINVVVDTENDAPVAYDDTIATQEDTPVTCNVLDNDKDQDTTDVLSFVMFTSDTSGLPGTLNASADGELTFTPDANYHGSFTIAYVVGDPAGATDTATITITVNAVNDAPAAQDGSKTTTEDTAATIDVSSLISDADIATDADVLSVSVEADTPLHGTVSAVGTVITYTPHNDFNGTDSFVYTVTDKASASDSGAITVTVTPVNDAPIANGDTAVVNEDTAAAINVLANDSDADTNAALNAAPQAALTIDAASISEPTHGSAILSGGQIQYTPDADYNGPDSFTYIVTDGEYTAQAAVNITVKQVNDNPEANDDTAVTNDEDMVAISVLANDTDIDTQDTLNADSKHSAGDFVISHVDSPLHGRANAANGNIYYTPFDTFAGTDTFAYTLSDGHGGTDSATVTVTVKSVNDPPRVPTVFTPAEGDKYGGQSTLHVTWAGSDIDGDALTYTLEYFDGAAWHVIEAGMDATSYDFIIPATLGSITNLQFRVNASDGEFTSGYGYSGHVSVDKDVPMNIVVKMTRADGRPYTAGTWTNQSVTVVAVSVDDASRVAFNYALEDKTYEAAANKTVTNGVHSVYIKAQDEFGNAAEFGGYQVKVDKQAPSVPESGVTVNGSKADISLSLLADPGGSGNRTLKLPDGTRTDVTQQSYTYAASANGDYAFELTDTAGNTMSFTVKVDVLDTTPPSVSCDSGDYVTGETSDKDITASLTFTDNESDITDKGYFINGSASYSGAYKSYGGSLTISEGQSYVHAYAKNAMGLTTYKTFGPFIVQLPVAPLPSGEASPAPSVSIPPVGDVVLTAQDLGGENTKVRLPNGEWTDKLVLEDIEPGVYLVEVMDENGNITTVQVTITDEAIAAGKYQQPSGVNSISYIVPSVCIAAILLLLLALMYNVKIEVRSAGDRRRALRTIKRFKRRKHEVTVNISEKRTDGGDFGIVKLMPRYARRMRGNTLIVTVDGREVLRVIIPEDTDAEFKAVIESWK